MKIDKIVIRNFKGISSFELSLNSDLNFYKFPCDRLIAYIELDEIHPLSQ